MDSYKKRTDVFGQMQLQVRQMCLNGGSTIHDVITCSPVLPLPRPLCSLSFIIIFLNISNLSKKDILKLLGGYPPAFFNSKKDIVLKSLVGIHQPFYFKERHF